MIRYEMKQYLKVSLIFLLALALRLAYAAYTGLDKPNFEFDYDASEYHQIALSFSQGQGYALEEKPTAKRPPIYPFFLSALYSLFGPKIWVAKVAQSILGALSCCLIFFLAKDLFEDKVATWAMLVAAVYPHFIFYSAYLLSETLFQFLLLIFTFLLCKLQDEFSPLRLLLSGLILGTAVLCRPVLAAFPLFLFFWYLIFHSERFLGIAIALVLGIGMILVMLPWVTRNYLVLEDFIPLSSQSGVTFYGGNNLDIYNNLRARGGWLPPNITFNDLKKEGQRSLKFWELTLDFWQTYPKETFILELFKFYRFWNIWPQTALVFQLISLLTYTPILLLFIHYLIFSPDKNRENLLPVIGLIVYFCLFSLLVYGSTRFRFPIEPLLLILAVRAAIKKEVDIKIPKITAFSLDKNKKLPSIKY